MALRWREGFSATTLVVISSVLLLCSGVEAFVAWPAARSWSGRHITAPSADRTTAATRSGVFAGRGWRGTIPATTHAAKRAWRGRRRDGALKMISLEVVRDESIPQMAEFFVSNFWENDVGPAQKRSLVRELVTDYRRRYGTLMGTRKLPSMLLAARSAKGEIVGCVAIEVSVCMGERVGVKARGLNPNSPDTELRPILANLTVGRAARRKGLAKRLVKRCEITAKEWGYDEVLLLVEENNGRARKLYQKLGYKMLFRDREAKKIVPDTYQIRDVPCVNVCMRRDLNANIFSNLFQMIRQ